MAKRMAVSVPLARDLSARRAAPIALVAVLGVWLAGCVTDPDYHRDRFAPQPPVGVRSITADRAVILSWIPNREHDLDGYHVYVSDDPYGPYRHLSFTHHEEYTHGGLSNGRTYYYGVSAVDRAGNESDLNDEVIHDTPRPEGFGLVLHEADGALADRSAFDFSREMRVHWDDPRADVFYDVADGVPYLVVPDEATDIQDGGYAEFDDVTWAPARGWSPTGFVEAIEGHVYVVWTRNDHYAKLRVIEITGQRIEVDWAYQSDKGNPELRPRASNRRARPGADGGAS